MKHRISSAYHPAANKHAEVAVKSAKRLLRYNVGPKGQLNTNRFTQALLAHRNTPDPSTGVTPAQIVFAHDIHDIIPQKSYAPAKEWTDMALAREFSYLIRHYSNADKISSR